MKIVDIKDKIFREYDVRGIAKTDIDKNVSYTFGKAFASYISSKHVVVGHDNRLSSIMIYNALIKGLVSSGANVLAIGLVTTPMFYFTKKYYKIYNGIMVTASHNPREYNGFKFSFNDKGNACGNEIYEFRDFIKKRKFEEEKGSIRICNIKEEYIYNLKKCIKLGNKKIKIVVDTGNGTGSTIIKDVLDAFNIEYVLLNGTSDGSFPNHVPDPCEKENQKELSKKVVELGYDAGIGIDGDADRVGIVDEKGNILSIEYLMILMYRYLSLDKRAIYDVKCSRILIDELDKLGYNHKMHRTGNSYMHRIINEEKYLFGGEYSGHLWFLDKYAGFDDGIYALLRVAEILSNNDKTMSQLLSNLNKYYSTDEIRIAVSDELKNNVVTKVKDYAVKKKYKINDIDGVRVEFEDGWALVRASNTSPNITVRFEAVTKERLEEIQDEFINEIEKNNC